MCNLALCWWSSNSLFSPPRQPLVTTILLSASRSSAVSGIWYTFQTSAPPVAFVLRTPQWHSRPLEHPYWPPSWPHLLHFCLSQSRALTEPPKTARGSFKTWPPVLGLSLDYLCGSALCVEMQLRRASSLGSVPWPLCVVSCSSALCKHVWFPFTPSLYLTGWF